MRTLNRGPAVFALIETLLAVAVFAAAARWGTTYWQKSLALGRMPIFYQEYFEPAVMVACHRGFVVSHPRPKALDDFLWRRSNRFYCSEIPADTTLDTQELFQGAWRYMIVTVGLAWRWLGISWSRMGPLFGILFGVTIGAAYGIFRLGMGRMLSLAGAAVLSLSTLHLTNLPHLRDYSKAPFTLVLVLLLGCLVRVRPRTAVIAALCAAYGVVLGLGYGFRTDLLIGIPPVFIVLFVFLDGGVRSNMRAKIAGSAAFLAAFLIVAQPIYSFVYEKGGGQWHVALLGLTTEFDGELGIEPAPYDWGRVYEDEFVITTVNSYVHRVHPDWRVTLLGTHGYDVNSGAYLREILSWFPGDIVTRGLASTLRITDIPFRWPGPPMDGLLPAFYKTRSLVLDALNGHGTLFVALALIAAAAADARLAFFLFFVVLYFGGYPAVQMANRHYFHLEFLTWWAIGFLLHHAVKRVVRMIQARRAGVPWMTAWSELSIRRAALCAAAALLVMVVPLAVLRIDQESGVRTLLRGYVEAASTPIPVTRDTDGFAAVAWRGGPDVQLMKLEINAPACGDRAGVTFRYDRKQPIYNYTRRFEIPRDPSGGTTLLFATIYPQAFQGLVLPAGCVQRVSWVDAGRAPLLLDATLTPGWERSPLYQRLPSIF